MTLKPGSKRIAIWLGAAALAGIVAGTGAVYVSGSGGGNTSAADADCAGAVAAARRLAPLVGGEVAAFRPAEKAESLKALAFTGPDGKPTSLAAFAGKTVLVNFWATWCVPCRAEMPALDRLQAARGGSDFQVVAVNLDTRNPERAAGFLQEVGASHLELYADPSLGVLGELKKRGLALSACRRPCWSMARAAGSASSRGRRNGTARMPAS